MDWLRKREQLEATIPEAWNLLCVAIEQTAEQFGWTAFAKESNLIAEAKRINTCIHVSVSPRDASSSKSIDICLDRRARIAVARDGHQDIACVRFGHGSDGKACVVDDDLKQISYDRASEIFLRQFLFGETVSCR